MILLWGKEKKYFKKKEKKEREKIGASYRGTMRENKIKEKETKGML